MGGYMIEVQIEKSEEMDKFDYPFIGIGIGEIKGD
jgi:hypothetical protein